MTPEAWRALVAEVDREGRSERFFLSRDDERALEDQAGDDRDAGYEMVEAMENVARLARDRALEVLVEWQPPAGVDGIPSVIGASIRKLEELPESRGYYAKLGVLHVISCLCRQLQTE
jgi:hypothetical protein